MGRSKAKKQQVAVDEPGPDDFTYLAVFFPVGRNGAAMAKDSDPEDMAAAMRIGTWLHYAGLPIRKLFSRKSEEHVLVEVREEVPQDVIESKLGAYRWADMLYTVLPKDADSESIVMRAKVRSHDAVEKMGGMVYFSVPRIVPDGPRSQSRFKDPFPQPKKYLSTEPSKFSAIKYLPLPPQLVIPQVDVKPNIHNDLDDTKLDINPDVKPDIKPDVKPSISSNVKSEFGQDIKPRSIKGELGDMVPNYDPTTEEDIKPSVKYEDKKTNSLIEAASIPRDIVPNHDPTREADDAKLRVKSEGSETLKSSVKTESVLDNMVPNYDPTREEIDVKPNLHSVEAEPPNTTQLPVKAENACQPRSAETMSERDVTSEAVFSKGFGDLQDIKAETEARFGVPHGQKQSNFATTGSKRPAEEAEHEPGVKRERRDEP